MIATPPNGRVRKNLADQLDRLDGILDGLADGLNEAVAAAVKDALATAVQQALAHPELRHQLTTLLSDLQPPPVPAPFGRRLLQVARDLLGSFWTVLRLLFQLFQHKLQRARQCLTRQATESCGYVGVCCQRLGRSLWTLGRKLSAALQWCCVPLRLAWRARRPLGAALALGLLAALASWSAAPWLASLCSGVGAFTSMLSLQALLALRRLLRPLRRLPG